MNEFNLHWSMYESNFYFNHDMKRATMSISVSEFPFKMRCIARSINTNDGRRTQSLL